MQSKNLVKFCAAGCGKTYNLCECALADESNKKTLIVSYTNKGIAAIENEIKKQNGGVLSNRITVKTWYDFLLSDLIKPYQSIFLGINKVNGINFELMYGYVNLKPNESPSRYVVSGGKLIPNEISKLALLLNQKSKGMVIKRLSEIYNSIYIDEMQDLAGYDLDIVKLLMESPFVIQCVGDYKQATYKTNTSNRNSNKSGKNCLSFFDELKKDRVCDIVYDLSTRRCNSEICNYANELFPTTDKMYSTNSEVTKHDGVFAIYEKDVRKYHELFKPQILVYDKNANNQGLRSMNYGVCKGLTFDRVLIVSNGVLTKYIEKGKPLTSPEKYYIAVTRARYSVALTIEKKPLKYKEIIELKAKNGDTFSIYRLS